MMFMFVTIAIAVIVVLFLLWPLFSNKTQQDIVERDAVNIQSAAARLSELKQDLEAGLISETQFQQYRLELETVALEDLNDKSIAAEQGRTGNKVLSVLIALLVPLLSIIVYQQIGSEQALSGDEFIQNQDIAKAQEEIKRLIADAEADIRNNPDDIDGRVTLGQVYMELERYTDAANMFSEAYDLRNEDPDILVSYAEALARAHGNQLTGRPAELLNTALALDPDHTRALWLAGFAEQQANNNEDAIKHWRRLLSGLEAGSEVYQQLEKLIIELESGSSTDEIVVGSGDTKQSVTVNVSLAPEFQEQFKPESTLFVFARAFEGPPMPLAVHRGLAKDLPVTVTLDDSMAMMPQMALSQFPKVIIGARLSSNNQPQGQPGDYEGFSDTIEIVSTSVVDVVIDSIKP